jgi:hypothetical protein
LRLTATDDTPSTSAALVKLPERAVCTKLTMPRRLSMRVSVAFADASDS